MNENRTNKPTAMSRLVGTMTKSMSSAQVSCAATSSLADTSKAADYRMWFAANYTPGVLFRAARGNELHCMTTDKAPTIGALATYCGEEFTVGWLARTLNGINQMMQVPADHMMTAQQLGMLAMTWVHEFPRLKASELGVFLFRLFAGRYGQQYYGAFNPMAIGVALADYLKERDGIVFRERQKAATAKAVADREAVSEEVRHWRAVRASAEWETLPADKRESVEKFLAIYCGVT